MLGALSDAMTELRRPFRLRGPTSRRAFAGLALVTGLAVAVCLAIGRLLSTGAALPDRPGELPLDPLRDPVLTFVAGMPGWTLWLAAISAIPLAFAMVRRSTAVGIPRAMSVLGTLVLITSVASILFHLEARISFPLSRGLWTMAVEGAEDPSMKVGLIIVLSPIFLVTLIADILLILLIGWIALAFAVVSLIGVVVVAALPDRKDLIA